MHHKFVEIRRQKIDRFKQAPRRTEFERFLERYQSARHPRMRRLGGIRVRSLHAGFSQRSKAANDGNAPRQNRQSDQEAEKRTPDAPYQSKRPESVMLGPFERDCAGKPNCEEQEYPQRAANGHTHKKSRKITKSAEGRCRDLSRE